MTVNHDTNYDLHFALVVVSVEDHLATEHDTEARCVLGDYSAQREDCDKLVCIVGIVSSGSKTNVNSLL